ncbi:MAG: molybdopterin molybdenumtransferase MoeA [Candidatus Bathyarchaeota archaeon]|nr:MAG: molybdopterin molybdenumtransferase MoeA [Candidatus Bathyarchaeota archaeon]
MKRFVKLTRIDRALHLFFEQVQIEPISSETVPLTTSVARILAEDVVARFDVPGFSRSAVDGYALKAQDTIGASSTNPLVLDVIGVVEIGWPAKTALSQHQSVYIDTGAVLPNGANAVIMAEYTESIGNNKIEIYRALTPGENVSFRGEDVKKGERILLRGTVLRPQDVGVLSALGYSQVKVVRRPKIAILSTGNELIDAGEKWEKGKIIDTNRPILISMVKELGGEPIDLGIAKDEFKEIQSKVVYGLNVSDMVLVSGGTSVGAKDLMPTVINSLKKPGILVHGLCMKPGKPTALAAAGNQPIVLLPGFPVAAMVSFNAVVIPIVLKLCGTNSLPFWNRVVHAKMTRRIPSSLGNKTFTRVLVKYMKGKFVAEPLRTSGSGVISSMIRANGLVAIPENKEGLEAGEEVEVILLRPLKART